jgi:hypothetical protein
MQSCNNCHHRSTTEISCENCHAEAAAIYSGNYLDRDTPDYMFDEEVECADCHVPNGSVVRPQLAVCLDCHDEGYDQDALEWQNELSGLMQDITRLIDPATAPRALRGSPEFQQARAVLNDFAKGAATGVHNYELTSEVLIELKTRLEQQRAQ